MSKICEICGKAPRSGNSIIRHGLAKYKGGIGLHTTGISKRRFLPNIKVVRAKTSTGGVTRMKVCAACIKAGKIVKP
ncbi:MAG: 50S ribosomal protein L28 [Kiritimatiellae bacterium]|nr:50S ribosomal protein L28 [Kiritimatiellia bacterium]